MCLYIFQESAEAVLQKETDGQARGIGRKPENIERPFFVQQGFIKTDGLSFQKQFQHSLKLRFAVAAFRTERERFKRVLIRRFTACRPAYDCRISDTEYMLSICQQVVQRRSICKRRVFSGWRVQVLFLAVGAEGGGVKGNQCRAAGLRPLHTLDRGMDSLDGSRFAGHQTNCLGAAAACCAIMLLP